MKWTSLFNKIRPTIGIDLGSANIKAVELRGNLKNLQLVNYHQCLTPPEAINDGCIVEQEAMVRELDKLVEEYGWQGRQVTTCVNGRKVMIRHLKLPVMPDRELMQAIHFEAEKYLPFGNQEIVLDYVNLGQISGQSDKQLSVLLAAVPQEIALSYYQVFSVVGLDLVAIDIIPLALQRGLFPLMGQTGDIAIADIGAELTNFAVFSNAKVSFARTIPVAGNNINRLTAGNLFQEAAATRGEESLDFANSKPSWNGLSEEALSFQHALEEGFLELTRELKRSIDFWRTQSQGKTIAKLYLTGGTVQVPGMGQLLSRELELPVEIYIPLKTETSGATPLNSNFAVAYGLALRGISG